MISPSHYPPAAKFLRSSSVVERSRDEYWIGGRGGTHKRTATCRLVLRCYRLTSIAGAVLAGIGWKTSTVFRMALVSHSDARLFIPIPERLTTTMMIEKSVFMVSPKTRVAFLMNASRAPYAGGKEVIERWNRTGS